MDGLMDGSAHMCMVCIYYGRAHARSLGCHHIHRTPTANPQTKTGSIGACPPDLTTPNTPAVCGALAHFGSACPTAHDVPPKPKQDVEGKVALISRGGCAFADKIKAARVGALSGWVSGRMLAGWEGLLGFAYPARGVFSHMHTDAHTHRLCTQLHAGKRRHCCDYLLQRAAPLPLALHRGEQ